MTWGGKECTIKMAVEVEVVAMVIVMDSFQIASTGEHDDLTKACVPGAMEFYCLTLCKSTIPIGHLPPCKSYLTNRLGISKGFTLRVESPY